MKIKHITRAGKKPVYDLTTREKHQYLLENGVVTHNTAVTYSANQIFVFSKSQEKVGTEIVGYNFTINIEKSRYVREKAKLPFLVTYDGGIQKYSGLLDIALETGFIVKPSNGWYSRVDEDGVVEDKKHRAKDTNDASFWNPLLTSEKFKDAIRKKFKVSASSLQPLEDVEDLNTVDDTEDL